jgi:transposase
MTPYSTDLRERVLADCDAGLTTRLAAHKYTVSESWVRRLKHVRRETGRTAPAAHAGGRPPAWVVHAEAIRAAVRHAPDATLNEYRARFALPVSRSALARALVALALPRKKSRSGPASRTART